MDATAQDRLSNPERALIPGLWTKLHNAEYRLDVSTSPAWVWGQIAGEVETLVREIKQRRTKSQVGVSNVAWGTESPTQPRRRGSVTVVDGERDGRVRDAMSRLTHVRGREVLEEVLRIRDEEARGVWEQAGPAGIASWGDLLGISMTTYRAADGSQGPRWIGSGWYESRETQMTGVGPDARIYVIQSGQFATIGPAGTPTGLFQSTLDLPGRSLDV